MSAEFWAILGMGFAIMCVIEGAARRISEQIGSAIQILHDINRKP